MGATTPPGRRQDSSPSQMVETPPRSAHDGVVPRDIQSSISIARTMAAKAPTTMAPLIQWWWVRGEVDTPSFWGKEHHVTHLGDVRVVNQAGHLASYTLPRLDGVVSPGK